MKNKMILYFIGLVMMMIFLIFFAIGSTAQAGGPWSEQYCDVEVTKIRVVDQQGNVKENLTEEKVVCKDGASDFLFNMGIADNCKMYTWDMPVGEVVITQRQIACKKMDGTGYEIVQGYHGID
tara:strand:- start:488 stop:856 length:369 start_codon:yes stop_codon:yes gene_type:complete